MKYESQMSVLEEELRNTKEAWSSRLSDERKDWQSKALDKVNNTIISYLPLYLPPLQTIPSFFPNSFLSFLDILLSSSSFVTCLNKAECLQSQIDSTRDYYKQQIDQLHRELADLLATHRTVKVNQPTH